MRYVFLLLVSISLLLSGCGTDETNNENNVEDNQTGENVENNDQQNKNTNDKTDEEKDQKKYQNEAFRNVTIKGENGSYVVSGEARVFEGVFQYGISNGHRYLLKDYEQVKKGGPNWSSFTLNLSVKEDQLPMNGTLTLELYEESAKDGSVTNQLVIPLESFK